MILQALNEHYQRLLEDPESGVAPPGYSPAKVSHAIVINKKGELVDILQISTQQNRKLIPKILLVPEQAKKTSGINANYLCENSAYLLGIEFDKDDGYINESPKKFERFKEVNEELLQDSHGDFTESFKNYLRNWDVKQATNHPVISRYKDELSSSSNIAVMLDCMNGFLHDSSEAKSAWETKLAEEKEDIEAQCLVTGNTEVVARLHPSIKNVIGAQTSGASLVSFNADAFTSYNKTQSYNAPVSKKAAFAYGTALNYLIASDINRIRLADTTMVFWADKLGGKVEESILSWCLDPTDTETNKDEVSRKIDHATVQQARTILEHVKSGLPIGDSSLNADTRFFLLGLAPNAARLSVRFWQVNSFGNILSNIAQHYCDMDIIGIERFGSIIPSWKALKATAIQEDSKNITPLLGGQFLKAILSAQMYPQTLFNAALIRCRAGGEHNGVTTIRAAIIKAFLKRKYRILKMAEKEALITMGLNEKNNNSGYQLGRLFSLLEKVQRDALGNNINATIRDRYFGAASATPGSVFPLLLRLSRHHISKSEYGNLSDRKIQEVLNGLDTFPAHLNLEDQGQFILGYYHQNHANYSKNTDNKEG